MRKFLCLILTLAGLIYVPAFARAQGQSQSERAWESMAVFYGMGASVTGDASFGPVETEVDVSFGDILDNLQLGFAGRYRGQSERFSLVVDAIYLALGNSKEEGPVTRGDLDMFVLDVTGAYRFLPIAEAFAGLRYTDLKTKIGLGSPVRRELRGSDAFWDPVFGARILSPLSQNRKWYLQAQGDIGGFGAGMDLTWQLMGHVGYRPAERVSLWFGYRVLAQDFDDAGETERFGMNVRYHGPDFGLAFHF